MSKTATKGAAAGELPGPQAPPTALVPSGQDGPPEAPAGMEKGAPPAPRERPRHPNLFAALAQAQQQCVAATHDRRNKFHGYDYASAEAVLLAAQEALDATGLAVVPMGWDVEMRGGVPVLKRLFQLGHESGECSTLIPVTWPILEEKGRPLDKALAGALTETLAYYYRDLLRMPRVRAGDDLAGRVDAPPPRPMRGPVEVVNTTRFQPQWPEGAPAPEAAAGAAPAAAPDKSLASPCTLGQAVRIGQLRDDLGLSPGPFDTRLKAKYGADSVPHLTSGQAAEVIGLLEQQAYKLALADREAPAEERPDPGAGKS